MDENFKKRIRITKSREEIRPDIKKRISITKSIEDMPSNIRQKDRITKSRGETQQIYKER